MKPATAIHMQPGLSHLPEDADFSVVVLAGYRGNTGAAGRGRTSG